MHAGQESAPNARRQLRGGKHGGHQLCLVDRNPTRAVNGARSSTHKKQTLRRRRARRGGQADGDTQARVAPSPHAPLRRVPHGSGRSIVRCAQWEARVANPQPKPVEANPAGLWAHTQSPMIPDALEVSREALCDFNASHVW